MQMSHKGVIPQEKHNGFKLQVDYIHNSRHQEITAIVIQENNIRIAKIVFTAVFCVVDFVHVDRSRAYPLPCDTSIYNVCRPTEG